MLLFFLFLFDLNLEDTLTSTTTNVVFSENKSEEQTFAALERGDVVVLRGTGPANQQVCIFLVSFAIMFVLMMAAFNVSSITKTVVNTTNDSEESPDTAILVGIIVASVVAFLFLFPETQGIKDVL